MTRTGTHVGAPREVLRLFPLPARRRRLEGLYLNECPPRPTTGMPALVYANFATSLDGRIAVTDAAGVSRLPEGLTNPRTGGCSRSFRRMPTAS